MSNTGSEFTREIYLNKVLDQMPRLLSLLDRNPFSVTYGCFDRSYWHHRTTDFPVSTAQMSTRTLAVLFHLDHPRNPYFRSAQIGEWVRAGVEYTLKIQHRDGSFDEWYPNERGWAGPTAYVGHALFETYLAMESSWPQEFLARIESSLKHAALHLSRRDEHHVLANHYALALTFLKEVSHKWKDRVAEHGFQKFYPQFKKLISPEGWTLEYDGCDIGYNLGSLNFLVDLDRVEPLEEIHAYVRSSLEFLKYFAYPDGSFAGSLGSRHTQHGYLYALEYWTGRLGVGSALLRHQRQSLKAGPAIECGQQEDHYLHYRLCDHLRAFEYFQPEVPKDELPYAGVDFSRHFSEAGFWVEKKGPWYLLVALHRGGAVKVYDTLKKRLLVSNNGWVGELKRGKKITSLVQGSGLKESKVQELVISGTAAALFNRQFSPLSFLVFRGASLFLVNPWWAQKFKVWIRKVMIFSPRRKEYRFTRCIRWSDTELMIQDELPESMERLWWGGDFSTRYVPQSAYFEPTHTQKENQVLEFHRPGCRLRAHYPLNGEGACVPSVEF